MLAVIGRGSFFSSRVKKSETEEKSCYEAILQNGEVKKNKKMSRCLLEEASSLSSRHGIPGGVDGNHS